MSYIGTVKNGVVVLPPEAKFTEGSQVEVTPREVTAAEDPFLAAVIKSAKPRPYWPKDYVHNHGHYVSGEPKKA